MPPTLYLIRFILLFHTFRSLFIRCLPIATFQSAIWNNWLPSNVFQSLLISLCACRDICSSDDEIFELSRVRILQGHSPTNYENVDELFIFVILRRSAWFTNSRALVARFLENEFSDGKFYSYSSLIHWLDFCI